VYTSDVTPAATEQLGTNAIPDKFNVVAIYPIAPLKTTPQPSLAQRFIQFVLSDGGQSILGKWGFNPP
jgi:molybdate transport system substrate-binding protein